MHDVGSTILVHGSEELKKQHLNDLVNGDVAWCQGYSEPGSGSDLASVQTRGVRDGDDFKNLGVGQLLQRYLRRVLFLLQVHRVLFRV